MAGLISQKGCLFKVTFPFRGEQHEVHGMFSLVEAGLVGMTLAVRAAEELQQALDAAVTGAQDQPGLCLPKAAALDDSRLPPASFSQLVEQLQACVDWRNKKLARCSEDETIGMIPLCGLLAAATSLGCAAATHSLALLNPSAATAEWPWEGDGSAAHRAAQQDHADTLRALLAAAPGAVLAIRSSLDEGSDDVTDEQPGNWGVMHSAAESGSLQAVQVLLEAAPGLAQAITDRGRNPMHVAAEAGHAPVVQALLQAAPEAAWEEADDGELPLHVGAGHVEVVRLLLAAAPGTALARTREGWTALHFAASKGATASVQALLQAAPETALMADGFGSLPLHQGVTHVEVVQMLLAAAPGTALSRDMDDRTALHVAASHGAPASARALLRAAPEAAGIPDAEGRTPLEHGLDHLCGWYDQESLEALRVLVAEVPSPATFAAMAGRSVQAALLFADFIIAAPPLTAEQWAYVPAWGCPGLGRALSAALAHSHEQARQLVRLLPTADATRLRTFALALARLQRRLRVVLPGDVAGRLLGLCLAD